MKRLFRLTLFCFLKLATTFGQTPAEPFRNENLPLETRLADLLSRLTLNEKIGLLGYEAQAVERLQIPSYNWWNEALHGVARAGEATIFPQAIGMAASFDEHLMHEVATVISTEARAKYNLAVQNGRRSAYSGLTFWSPNINIFRDPRWGRGQETYGEDPFLTSKMGAAFVRGLQGDDPGHLKTAACAKHFAVHSGPESERHGFNARVSEKDLRETYLYAFQKLVVGAGVEAVMCAYNRVNDEPCCTSTTLLQRILRDEWQFRGHVVTDCWALDDIFERHKTLPNSVAVAAEAIKKGINLDCSHLLQTDVSTAIQQHFLTEKDVETALAPTLRTEFRLGFFDKKTPFDAFGRDSVANPFHIELARKMARESMVLLKNDHQTLPLNRKKYGSYMILGPNAASLDALIGNYHGTSSHVSTFVEGISQAVGPEARVEYDLGCDFQDTTHFGGIWAAGNAEVSIVVLGLSPVYEGEAGDAFLAENGGDRLDLSLPKSQLAFLKRLRKETKTPIVVVVAAGSAVDISAIEPFADAILLVWYAGGQGGNALADLLFGEASPSGRLPVTFYRSLADLPDYSNYGMRGRTYRYFEGAVQFPFGFGLSYSTFEYEWAEKPIFEKNRVRFAVKIKNSGAFDADEVAQAYVHFPKTDGLPLKEMKAFRRISLKKGEAATVVFEIPKSDFEKWDAASHSWKLAASDLKIVVGSHSADERLSATVYF